MQQSATVLESNMLSPNVVSLKLGVAGGIPAFRAGQWLNVYVNTPDGPLKRAYSIASAPSDPCLEFAITRVQDGLVSPLLHALRPGDELAFDGPHGLFTRDAREVAALFVATGTGVAPFRSMLREELDRSGAANLTLLFGARTEDDILYRDEFEAMAKAHPGFRYDITLSRPGQGWTGRSGYVQAHLPGLLREVAMPHVYVCGLTKMVSEVRALLKGELGYDRKRIHSERYD